MQKRIKLSVNDFRSNEKPSTVITKNWSDREVMLAIQGKVMQCFCS